MQVQAVQPLAMNTAATPAPGHQPDPAAERAGHRAADRRGDERLGRRWAARGFMNPLIELARPRPVLRSSTQACWLCRRPWAPTPSPRSWPITCSGCVAWDAQDARNPRPPTFRPGGAGLVQGQGHSARFDYRDVWKEEQANAFTVAKMLNADMLVEVRALVECPWPRARPISSSPPPSSRCW